MAFPYSCLFLLAFIPFSGIVCLWHLVTYTYYLLVCCSHFFFKVEVSPSMTGRTLEEETVATLSVAFPSVEEELLSGDIAKEAGQPM